jgi:predicted SnoaL-like aldol condensation-catalyzing enzyme
VLLAFVAMIGCVSTSKLISTPVVDSNRRVVLAFYNEALVSRHVRGSFERYVSPAFIEHKPDVVGGTREETIVFLGGLIKELPEARWEVIRTIAEGEFVFLHARFTPSPGTPPYSIADIFRLQNGLIVEHWDAVGRPPEHQRNPNPRF